ncbi:hypothetical protein [Halothermothrix orenii]|uniref:Uncharacterized protein n=1 Tax=Halothermothrix orenii (strain H 168 / OCM 544 / DSM 9562) TaxID=373903 RepID=B8CXK0_HALOH|nr:hypothetical protein [Halothermothrix orenii]ACL70019.1 hypothetical protein Hore_12690 [Halothermothrix orenii H 168]
MKRIFTVVLSLTMLFGLSLVIQAASTSGGTSTLGLEAKIGTYGEICVMDGGVPVKIETADPDYNSELYEGKIRVRTNGNVTITARFGKLVNTVTGEELDFTLDFMSGTTDNDFTLDSRNSIVKTIDIDDPGVHFFDVTMTLPQWSKEGVEWDSTDNGWWEVTPGTYKGNVVFTISAPPVD